MRLRPTWGLVSPVDTLAPVAKCSLIPPSCVLALGAVLLACQDNRAIDPFPVRFDDSAGAVALAVDVDGERRPAVVDTLTALTVVDPYRAGQPVPPPQREEVDLMLVGLGQGGTANVPRVRFTGAAVLAIHPCGQDSLCQLGPVGNSVTAGVVLGSDVLSRGSVRFDFPAAEIRFFPEAVGTDAQLATDCFAVMPSVFAGGSTVLIGGTEVSYTGRRPALGVCMGGATTIEDGEIGSDALMVASTGLSTTILAASSYDRYAQASGAPARATLPQAELHLLSGPVTVRLGAIDRLAITGSVPGEDNERGPCRELYLNQLMSVQACEDPQSGVTDCPCPNNQTFCRAAAAMELSQPIEVAILADDHPLLQSLRDELRPEKPELDGILGASAMSDLRIEFDYPNGRIIARCETPEACTTRPEVRSRSALSLIERCLSPASGADAGPATGDAGLLDGGMEDASP